MKYFFALIFVFSVGVSKEKKLQLGPDKKIYQECANCHRSKDLKFVPEGHQPTRKHSEIKLTHGNKEMSCNHCHDKNNHNFLASMEKIQVSFRSPSPVCFQCHSDVFKSWEKNFHGKKIGGWKVSEIVQWQCTQCHNAHAVKFAPMQAQPAPHKPKLLIPKKHK